MAWEYYEFLGIDPASPHEAIKRACFRKRKQLAVSKDLKGLERLNEVSATLQDERARAEYDSLQQYGEQVAELMGDATAAMEDERWIDASRSLKHVLALIPGQPSASNLLGICYLNENKHEEALKLYARLTTDRPEVALYAANYGQALLQLASMTPDSHESTNCKYCGESISLPARSGICSVCCPECGQAILVNPKGDKENLLLQARQMLQQAIDNESYNSSHYVAMAQTFAEVGDYERALHWVEESLTADGTIDASDTQSLLYACQLHVMAGRPNKVMETARRLLALSVEEGAEFNQYVGFAFASDAYELTKLRAYEPAAVLADAALLFVPHDPNLINLRDDARELASASRETELLLHDSTVVVPVKRAALFAVACYSGIEITDREGVFRNILDQMASYAPSDLKRALTRLENQYPSTYRCGREFFDGLRKDLEEFKGSGTGQGYAASDDCCSSSCVLCVFVAIVILVLAKNLGLFAGLVTTLMAGLLR